jgi:ribonuclease P protein component
MLAPKGHHKPKVVLKRLSGRNLYLSIVKKTNPLDPKIYFQISKKMVLKATDRNLLKRRLRSLLRGYKEVLKSDQALVIGLKVKTPPHPTLTTLKQDLDQLLG